MNKATITVNAVKRWYYRPVHAYIMHLMKRGKITTHEAAKFIAERCYRYEVKK